MTAKCEFARSDMTPCVKRDGDMCYAFGPSDEPVCVGCGKSPEVLGLKRPADWDATIAMKDKRK